MKRRLPSIHDLVARAQAGDDEAFEILVRRFESRIRSWVRRLAPRGAAGQDLHQECLLAFHEAVKTHIPERGQFHYLAYLCVWRRACDLWKARRRDPLASWHSLDELVEVSRDPDLPDDERYVPLIEVIGGAEAGPESAMVAYEDLEEAEELVYRRLRELTPLEAEVFSGYLTGASRSDLSRRLGVTLKSVENARQRAVKKLGRFFSPAG